MSAVIGLDTRPQVIIVTEFVAGAAIFAAIWAHWPWQAMVAIATVIALLGVVQIRRHTAAHWLILAVRWRRHRARLLGAAVPDPVDVNYDGSIAGVRLHAGTLTAMVAVAGAAYVPTTLARGRASDTANLVPLRVLRPLVDQFGLAVSIEVVSAGQRRAMTGNYAALYEKIIGPRPVAAQRRTWLILRAPVIDSVDALAKRSSLLTAMAVAAERCARQLHETGCRARVCTATEVVAAEATLLGPATGEAIDKWSHIESSSGALATYVVAAKDMPERPIDQLWVLHANAVSNSVHLRPSDSGAQMALSVRIETIQHKNFDVPDIFRRLPGEQSRALRAARATAERLPHLDFRSAVDFEVHAAQSGVLLGRTTVEKFPFLLPLTDPLRTTAVSITATPVVVRQIVLRTSATGERIAVYARNPATWSNVGRSSRIWVAPSIHAQPPGPVSVMVVDGVIAPSIAASSVVTVNAVAPVGEDGEIAPGLDVQIIQNEDLLTVQTVENAWTIEPVYYDDEANFLREPSYV